MWVATSTSKSGNSRLGQLQADGVGLLGRQVVRLCEGLDEVGSTAARPFSDTAPW